MKTLAAALLPALLLAACSPAPAESAAAALTPAPEAAAAPPPQKDPLLSAVGLGVSDLAKSTDFYVNVMGMQKVRSYHLDYMDEELLGYPDVRAYAVAVRKHGFVYSGDVAVVEQHIRTKSPTAYDVSLLTGDGRGYQRLRLQGVNRGSDILDHSA
jgi:hypothetical protein